MGKIKEFLSETAVGEVRKADLVIAQEHHVGEEDLHDCLRWGKRAGWKVLASPATSTAVGGTQGGVLIATKSRMGMGLAPGDSCVTLVAGRLMACHVDAMCKGGVVVYNAYLWTSEGLTARNVDILEVLMRHKAGHGKPWFLGGDLQTAAEDLRETRWPRDLDAVIVAPEGPTCSGGKSGGRTIDYFLVDRRVKGFFGAATTWLTSPFKPHSPVAVEVRGGWQRAEALYLRKPRAFPKQRLIGPLEKEEDWAPLKERVRCAIEGHGTQGRDVQAGALEASWRWWCRLAEREVVANCGLKDEEEKYTGRGGTAEFAWKPVVGWTGTRRSGANSKLGVVARVLATRLGEIIKCTWALRRQIHRPEKSRGHLRRLILFAGDFIVKHNMGGDHHRDQRTLLASWGSTREVEGAVVVWTVAVWAAQYRARAEEEELQARKKRQESWQLWVDEGSKSGGAAIHAWIREPKPWVPAAAEVDNVIHYSPTLIAEDCLGGWAKIWNAEKAGDSLDFDDWEGGEVSGLTGDKVRNALAKFKVGTGVGMCGWHPKDWSKVGDTGLECLAQLMALSEKAGIWPAGQCDTAMIRIDKEGGIKGDYRLIGLMPTLYRVWAKMRRQECMEWEEANARAYDYASKGRGAVSEVWDVALLDEGARLQGADTACWAGDLSKFYERIPLAQLVAAAKDLGFPASMLRMALGIYKGARHIQYEKAFSSAVFARSGIIAGCSLATTLVKVFMWRTLDAAWALHPGIKLKVYLDDILLQWVGHLRSRRFVPLKGMVRAIVHYTEVIDEELAALVNTSKTCMVASTKVILQKLGEQLRGYGVIAEDGCRLLGVDYGCGGRRRRKVMAKRKSKAVKKCRRILRLSKTRADRGRLWSTGVAPSVGFGAEVFGINGSELMSLRKQAGRVALPGEGGGACR